MPTLTTNYRLKKPLVNDPTDQEVWGYYLNDDLDVIDSELKNNSNAAALAQSKAEQAASDANTALNAAQSSVQPSEFTGANQSLASPGYQRLPGGLIIQWGTGQTAVGGGSVSFPVSFTTACLNVQVTNWTGGSPLPPANWLAVVSKSTTGAVVINKSNDASTAFFYLAIGY